MKEVRVSHVKYVGWVFQVEEPTVQRSLGRSFPGCFQMSNQASVIGAETAKGGIVESGVRDEWEEVLDRWGIAGNCRPL